MSDKDIQDKVQSLETTSARLLIMQEQTTTNVNKLTGDLVKLTGSFANLQVLETRLLHVEKTSERFIRALYTVGTALAIGMIGVILKINL